MTVACRPRLTGIPAPVTGMGAFGLTVGLTYFGIFFLIELQ